MTKAVSFGQRLKGEAGFYTIAKQLQDNVWLAFKETVVVKSIRHFRLQNERDFLLRFQNSAPYFRRFLDEIEDPPGQPALILRHLDNDLLQESNHRTLTRAEVKYVAKRVLSALGVLHRDDIKPSIVLINYGQNKTRFSDIQMADFGSMAHQNFRYAQDRDPTGTPIFPSPEAQLQMRWGTATDIWSFGAMARQGFHIFKPNLPVDSDECDLKILMKHHQCFGSFPASYDEIADQDRLAVLVWIMQNTPLETPRPFHLITSREISQQDMEFVFKIRKLDHRDRPTADSLFGDGWLLAE
ncbi:serine/threonine protein kinase [Aspergillus caelatus]|uniref:Serine/threonine protein kinase n=1 Tax=Aspergillus caelatus TaxID=61420 RepID=A0A5N7A5I9_9EURO|nr:serine/threonine protein kinase [Aspergillus caelatus]KAE8363780.1 serine/threonine protein kinase [Aspergillus caelatus]